jgi:hypothetical protein
MDQHTQPPTGPEPITYTLEGEPYTTGDRTLTPKQILDRGGFDVATHYLVELRGNSGEKTSYEGKSDAIIHMHPNMKFLAISTGPTPVS